MIRNALPTERLQQARDRLARARDESTDRLWHLRVGALERVEGWLDAADDVPALGRVASAAGGLVERRLERLAEVPVDGWAELNARNAIAAVKGLDRRALWAARRQEAATKNRKTVLKAIDTALALPEPVAEPELAAAT